MPDLFSPDEALRNEAIEQAMEGNFVGARYTAARIVTRQYLREAWSYILCIQRDREDVQGIKETISSCPDPSLLRSHDYSDLPLHFARMGNRTAALEIVKAMGAAGSLALLCILTPWDLLRKGDYAGAREAVAKIEDELMRSQINYLVEEHQRNRDESGEAAASLSEGDDSVDQDAIQDHAKTYNKPPRRFI
jgi:hypothetical protein